LATNIFNITSAHNKAKLALHGDMSVSFNQAVTSQFSVQLFTSTSELFTLNTTYQFKDINGTLVTSIIFGGRPGIFIELMFDSTNQIWYIVSNNLTSNTETTKAVKVEQAIANTGGLPLYDIGDTFSYKGVPVQRIDNGISSRYTPGFIRINANIPQPNLTDPTNFGWQNLGTITIPGGTMVGKTNAVINFVMNSEPTPVISLQVLMFLVMVLLEHSLLVQWPMPRKPAVQLTCQVEIPEPLA
jgi:hypothetical protein